MEYSELEILEEKIVENLNWKNFQKQYSMQAGTLGTYFKFVDSKSSRAFSIKIIKYNRKKKRRDGANK